MCFVYVYCVCIVCVHCVCPLFVCIVYVLCVCVLCMCIVCMHCVCALCMCFVYVYCVCPTCVPMCAGVPACWLMSLSRSFAYGECASGSKITICPGLSSVFCLSPPPRPVPLFVCVVSLCVRCVRCSCVRAHLGLVGSARVLAHRLQKSTRGHAHRVFGDAKAERVCKCVECVRKYVVCACIFVCTRA